MAKRRKSKAFTKPARPCWVRDCKAMIEFRRTSKSPKGAWVDAGTHRHHPCQYRLANWIRAKKKAEATELFQFEELHPIAPQPTEGRRKCEVCGEAIYCREDAPQAQYCEVHYWAWLDANVKP